MINKMDTIDDNLNSEVEKIKKKPTEAGSRITDAVRPAALLPFPEV